MLAIEKVDKPGFFDKWINNEEGYSQALREHIIKSEQQDVCCYCEKQISAHGEDSHLEHIRPQSRFPKLAYDYKNLVVSCQTRGRCGDAKGSRFSDHFIVPTEENPADYLTYSPNGEIIPINKNKKGRETLDILNLNAPKLRGARRTLFKQLSLMSNSLDLDDFETHFPEYPTFIQYFKDNFLD